MGDQRSLVIPDGVNVSVSGSKVTVNGKSGSIERDFGVKGVEIISEAGKVTIQTDSNRRKIIALVGTIKAHIKNMIFGVTNGYTYKLKIVFSQFPMNTAVQGETFIIKNFLGEKIPRKARIMQGVKVEVKDKDVIVTATDIEKAGQTAANIERATRITNRDPRIFQDGIYIVEKPRGVEFESKE